MQVSNKILNFIGESPTPSLTSEYNYTHRQVETTSLTTVFECFGLDKWMTCPILQVSAPGLHQLLACHLVQNLVYLVQLHHCTKARYAYEQMPLGEQSSWATSLRPTRARWLKASRRLYTSGDTHDARWLTVDIDRCSHGRLFTVDSLVDCRCDATFHKLDDCVDT